MRAFAGSVSVLLCVLVSPGGGALAFQITSAAFKHGESVPKKYTCDGANASPPLAWKEPPAGTKSFAVVCEDPDAPAGTWVHWVLYGLPAAASGLPEGVTPTPTLPDGSRQGTNDFKKTGYGGPCPPPGTPHQYYFRLYALDTAPTLAPGATKQQLLHAVEGHVIAQAEVMGHYGRQ